MSNVGHERTELTEARRRDLEVRKPVRYVSESEKTITVLYNVRVIHGVSYAIS